MSQPLYDFIGGVHAHSEGLDDGISFPLLFLLVPGSALGCPTHTKNEPDLRSLPNTYKERAQMTLAMLLPKLGLSIPLMKCSLRFRIERGRRLQPLRPLRHLRLGFTHFAEGSKSSSSSSSSSASFSDLDTCDEDESYVRMNCQGQFVEEKDGASVSRAEVWIRGHSDKNGKPHNAEIAEIVDEEKQWKDALNMSMVKSPEASLGPICNVHEIFQVFSLVQGTHQADCYQANFASWEPGHGGFKFRHPWTQYLAIGTLTRQCACRIEALNSYINSPIQLADNYSIRDTFLTYLTLKHSYKNRHMANADPQFVLPATASFDPQKYSVLSKHNI
ncbi:hypothetical protein Sjap_026062 [Stephania japonica]|uniref:Uncharacterized protein n=1 Tax=Stephania japonica TaxID=461633 RepID=A0AAP0HIJ1_9MAGN